MINELILNNKTESFLKFHSKNWVKELKEKVRKVARNDDDKDLCVNGKDKYFRVLIKKNFEIVGLVSGTKGYGLMNGSDGRLKFYVGGKPTYARVVIRRKEND